MERLIGLMRHLANVTVINMKNIILKYIESLGVTVVDGYVSDRVVIALSDDDVDGAISNDGSMDAYYYQNSYYDKVIVIDTCNCIDDMDF